MQITGTVDSILARKNATVWSIAADATVYEAVELLAHKNIGALPVMDNNRLLGIFTERDYTRKVILKGKSSKTTAVREIISKPVISVALDTSVEACMHLMTQKRVRHLPVIADGNLIGIISIGDLVNWTISAQHSVLLQMEQYLSGNYPG